MEARTYQALTLGFLGVGAVATVVLVVVALAPHLSGASIPAPPPALIDLGLGFAFGVIGISGAIAWQVAATNRRRADASARGAPPDLARDVRAHWKTAKRVWGTGKEGNFTDSFQFVLEEVLNRLSNGAKPTDPPDLAARKAAALTKAYAFRDGWMASNSLQERLLDAIDRAVESNTVDMDEESLQGLLEELTALLNAGARAANGFLQAADAANIPFDTWVKEQWTNFADTANRLAQDVRTLGLKVNELLGRKDNYFVQTVRKL